MEGRVSRSWIDNDVAKICSSFRQSMLEGITNFRIVRLNCVQ